MSWEYEYDENADETTIRWVGQGETVEKTIDGTIKSWTNGYPDTPAARDAINDLIQSSGTPTRIRMQFDFNYGFIER